MLNLSFSVQDLEYFLLLMMRLTGFFTTAPFFNTTSVPPRVKVGFAFFVSLLLYQFVVPHHALIYNTVLGYSVLVIKEVLAGILLGLFADLPMMILTFSGKIMDMEVGLSMVQIYDPTTRITEGFSGMFYHYLVLLILMTSGMHHYLIKAFVEVFTLVPVGNVNIRWSGIYNAILKYLGDYIIIGFRICLPIFAAMLMVNCILGILAKIAPQMNMFAVGMQIKVLSGLTIMYLTASILPNVSDYIYTQMKVMFVDIVKSLY